METQLIIRFMFQKTLKYIFTTIFLILLLILKILKMKEKEKEIRINVINKKQNNKKINKGKIKK